MLLKGFQISYKLHKYNFTIEMQRGQQTARSMLPKNGGRGNLNWANRTLSSYKKCYGIFNYIQSRQDLWFPRLLQNVFTSDDSLIVCMYLLL